MRPATARDVANFYGRPVQHRTQATIVEDASGQALGLGGLQRRPAGLFLFMDIAPGVDPAAHIRALLQASRRVLALVERTGRPAFAVRDPAWPRSAAFLEHFGFRLWSETAQQEVWRWAEYPTPWRSPRRR